MPLRTLPRSFYARPTLEVAADLLGKILICRLRGRVTSGRIVEVEAYLGESDPASHAFRGPTPRNQVMFGAPGHAYVYFTYGNHYCVNVVTERSGVAGAVLIRALQPLEGIAAMRHRRNRKEPKDLASGPGKLTQAMGIDLSLNGHQLIKPPLYILDDGQTKRLWASSPRIGITAGVDLPYRFFWPDSPCLSRAVSPARPKSSSRRTMSSSPK